MRYIIPYIEESDLKLYYEDLGVGEPIIFLHGSFSRGILDFAAQIPYFTPEYRCIIPDMRGHGRTCAANMEWKLPQLADDVIWLMDHLNIGKAHLIGFSLGGYAALYSISKYPNRFFTFISIGSVGCFNDTFHESAKQYEPDNLIKNGETVWIEHLKKDHFQAHQGDWQGFVNQILFNWLNYCQLSDDEFTRIIVPGLIITGANDESILPEELLKVKRLAKNIRIESIPGCGHGPHQLFEKPLLVNQLIKNFFIANSSVEPLTKG